MMITLANVSLSDFTVVVRWLLIELRIIANMTLLPYLVYRKLFSLQYLVKTLAQYLVLEINLTKLVNR